MAISTYTGWSLPASTKCCRRINHVHSFIPRSQVPYFQSLSGSKLPFFHVKFLASPSPILEEASASPNTPMIRFDVNFSVDAQKYSKLGAENLNAFLCGSKLGAENLNAFLCRLFEDPQTEALAFEYYQRLKQRPEFRPEKSALKHLIRYLLKSKKWDSILSVSEDFKIYRVVPSRATCSRLISVCIKFKKFKIAETLLNVFQPDSRVAVLAFVSAMGGYNRLHMYRSTISIFERMKLAEIDGDSRCYLKVMEAYMKTGDCEKVVQLFHEFESKKLPDSSRYLAQIYGILCKSLSRSGKASEALKHFRELSEKGVSVNFLYSTLVCSFASAREVRMAEELFREAKTKTILRDPELYMKLVLMYVEEGFLEETLEVVEAMKEANMRVSDCVLSAIVNGFSKKRGFRPAIRVFQQFVSQGFEPGQVTYALIINACCRLGQYPEAEKLFDEMQQKGFDKCVYAYSSMVVMYGRTGRLRNAMRLVAKMKSRGCEPNVWVYNSLIEMHGRAKNLRQVEKLWNEMKRRKVAPDKVTYTSMIGAYNKAREYETCIRFYDEHRMNGGVIDRAIAGIMVGVFSKVSRIDELLKLLRDMKVEGTGLDERLYQSAKNALADAGLQIQARWWEKVSL